MTTDHYPVCQNKQTEIKHTIQQQEGASLLDKSSRNAVRIQLKYQS